MPTILKALCKNKRCQEFLHVFRVKQSIQAMDICRRSRRTGISTSSGIYELPSQHSTGSGHLAGAGNTAGAVAGSNRLVMANLPTDNSNIAALAFNAAINNHVGLFTESFFCIQSADKINAHLLNAVHSARGLHLMTYLFKTIDKSESSFFVPVNAKTDLATRF
jgi:hypothetical protein